VADEDLVTVRSLRELAGLVGTRQDLFLRWSTGPGEDGRRSRDGLSGAPLPGLCAVPLAVEAWWGGRSGEAWVARRIRDYEHLAETRPPGTRAWVLEGEEVGRGPDNEPLVACIRPVAWVADEVVVEAADVVDEWGPLRRPEAEEAQVVHGAQETTEEEAAETVEVDLPSDPVSVSRARHLVRDLLDAHGVAGDELASALLAVSEIVTNAVIHAGTDVHVAAELAGARLRVSVSDRSPELPERRDPELQSPSGRGLRLVEAVADRWGVERAGDGKTVWFELRVQPPELLAGGP
jgi:anti-sigma regulatory factor (Ser/Thr protein kinase)